MLPLLILVRDAPSKPAAETLKRFSKLATLCVIAIAGTACFQGCVLGGGVAGLIGTAYGSVLLLKAALFAVLLGLAAINRFRLTPALDRLDAQKARWALLRTIAAETVLGLMVVLAAGVLSGLEPGMHAHPAATVASPAAPIKRRCAEKALRERQTRRPPLLRRRLHSLRALLGGLIPMHAGFFAGGLGLWRSERRRAEGHREGQSKHGNESFHRVSSC